MAGSIVFHHPLPVDLTGSRPSGSGVRPAMMLDAFQRLGYDVELVTGWSRERAQAARRIRADIDRGRRVDFVYGESATTPNALSDTHHLPVRPLVDLGFFAAMRKRDVPVGVFYRDVHWRFDQYATMTTLPKRAAARAFYRLDLLAYHRAVDVLFLPSLEMLEALPSWMRRIPARALPPGGDPVTQARKAAPELRLLYVGGVVEPLYDLSPLLSAITGEAGMRLTICCREEEAHALPSLPDNCVVVHESGPALSRRYSEADLAMLTYGPHPYRRFAVPVKLFEAVAHGVPVVAGRSTAAGRLVEQHGLGVVVEGEASLRSTLRRLRDDRHEMAALATTVATQRAQHGWTERARDAAEALLSVRR